MAIRIELLGGFRVILGDQVIEKFSTRQHAAALAYLAFRKPHERTRGEIIAQCWPDVDEERGQNSLSRALVSLRRQLEPPGTVKGAVLESAHKAVLLRPHAVTTDVLDFGNHLEAAKKAANPAARDQHLSAAIRLYRGELLPGFDQDWVGRERGLLADEYFHILNHLIERLIETREYAPALEYARRAVELEPYEEEAHRRLMGLYDALDRPREALKQYRKLKHILGEMRLRPSEAIERYREEIKSRNRAGISLVQAPELPSPSSNVNGQNPSMTRTVTFLAVDIDSTGTPPKNDETAVLNRCSDLLRSAFTDYDGDCLRDAGGSFLVAFAAARQAVTCAVTCQRRLLESTTEKGVDPCVRMAVHTGDATRSGALYDGLAVDLVKRLVAAVNCGQILCSQATETLLRRAGLPDISLPDLGLYRLLGDSVPERIFQIAHSSLARDFPPLRLEAGYQSRLPHPLTHLFGRKAEIASLLTILCPGGDRLVTLTGPGGVGKTRLSLEVARRLRDSFSGAVWFVPLADISESHRITGEILSAMDLPCSPQTDPFHHLTEVLGRQPSLLVLDNLEQMAEEARGMIRVLLDRLPTLSCLVTSRRPLALTGERLVPLATMPVPDACSDKLEELNLYDSVRLFVDRAQAMRPDFQLTHQNALAVAELCRRLEGIPLAIELAAARIPTLTPGQMLDLIQERRFDLLVNTRGDVAARHRTLWATIDWSFRLLPPEIQGLFARLSVFRGGWTAEAAEDVCQAGGKALPNLEHLLDCSMVQSEAVCASVDLPMRFRMLESLRECAREKLTEDERMALERRHLEFFVRLAGLAEPELRGARQSYWLDRLEAGHENLLSALQWAKRHDSKLGLQLAASLPLFWDIRCYYREGFLWLTDLLECAPDADPALRAKAFLAIGNFAKTLGNYLSARVAFHTSYELLKGPESRQARSLVLNGLGILAQEQGDYAEARRCLEESLDIKLELGYELGVATARGNLGYCAYLQNDIAAAQDYLTTALAHLSQAGPSQVLGNALNNLGGIARLRGDFTGALELLEKSLDIRQKLGDRRNFAYSFDEFARLAAAQGEPERATQLLAAAEALRAEIGLSLPPAEQERYDSFISLLRNDLGEDRFNASRLRGLAMKADQAVALARREQTS